MRTNVTAAGICHKTQPLENYFDIIFSQVNITLTVLLLILLVYWIFTMVSGVDLDLDFDLEVDIDTAVDVDGGLEGGNLDFEDVANAEVDREHVHNKRSRELKWWQVVLIYFNFVGLPFMFTFTFWIFCWWLISVLATSITNSYDNSFGYILVLIAIIPALILTKVGTTPFKSFFKHLNKDGDKETDFLGREATLLSTISDNKMGNAQVLADGNPMSIYVKSLDGSELRFRESVLIIKQSDDKNYFYVSRNK